MPEAYSVHVDDGDEMALLKVEADNIHFPEVESPHNYTTFTLNGETVYYAESHKVEQIIPHFGGETRIEEVNRYPKNNSFTM